ncbi:hypothetical protein, partial [Rhodopseudomonas palustris]
MIIASHHTAAGLIVDRQGAPVWPLQNDTDRAAVETICAGFGEDLQWVKADRGAAQPGRDVVVALGTEAAEVAALYAHLTGRRMVVATRPDAAARIRRCKAIVALLERIDDELIEQLYGADRRCYPGLITAPTLAQLRRRALVCAVAVKAARRDLPHRVELVANWPLATAAGASHSLLGRQAAPLQIRQALGRGDSAVLIHGHGDGIDGDLGGLILCPVDEDWQRRAAVDAAICKTTGLCYRNRLAIYSAAHREARLHPAQLSARLLIWSTCIGFPSPHGFIDPRWGVGARLAASASIGAFVTTWRITTAPAAMPRRLLDRMMAGDTVGRALGWSNSSGSRRGGARMCLFGDADISIAPHAAGSGAARSGAAKPP